MRKDLVVRQVEKEDMKGLERLAQEMATKQQLPSSRGIFEMAMAGVFDNGTITVVITARGEVAGMIIVSRHKQPSMQHFGVIRGIVVSQSCCEDGIEALLMNRALKICAEKGIKCVHQFVPADDNTTKCLCRQCQFSVERRVVSTRPMQATSSAYILFAKNIAPRS